MWDLGQEMLVTTYNGERMSPNRFGHLSSADVSSTSETLNPFPFSTHTACQLCCLQPDGRVSLHLLRSSKIRDKDAN